MPFEFLAKLGLDQSDYVAGFSQATATARAFGRNVSTHLGNEFAALKGQFAAIFGVAALSAGVRNIVQMGGHIQDLADKTELSTDEVQALDYAAKQTGSSFDDVASALKKVAVARDAALKGDKGKLASFEAFGISVQDLKAKQPVELFTAISEKIHAAGDSSQYLADLLSVAGKNSDSLIPAMKQGVGELIAEFNRLGLAIEAGTIKKLDDIGDEFERKMLKLKKAAAPAIVGGADLGADILNFLTVAARNIKSSAGGLFQGIDIDKFAADLVTSGLLGDLHAKPPGTKGPPGTFEPVADVLHYVELKEPPRLLKGETDTRNFDALSKVGGLGLNANQNLQVNIARRIADDVGVIREVLLNGNFGAERGPLE